MMAAALEVSEPVPAVVGMAIVGFIFSGLLVKYQVGQKNPASEEKIVVYQQE